MIPQMPFSQARFTIGVRLMGGKGILHGFTSTILLQKLSPLNKKKTPINAERNFHLLLLKKKTWVRFFFFFNNYLHIIMTYSIFKVMSSQ